MADGAEHLDPALWDSLFEAVQLRVLHIADEPVADATPLRSFAAVRPPQAAAECCAALRYLHQVVALERHAHLMTRQRAGDLELLLVEARRRLDGVVRFERNHALASCNVLFSNRAVSQSASCALCH